MAKPLSFKDFMVVDYRPGEDELINYRAKKRRNGAMHEEQEETSEELSIQGRRKLARSMKRRKTRLKMARKRAQKRLATKAVLSKRARRGARSTFADKLAGKGMKKSEVSVAKKKQIEKRLKQGGWQQRIKILQRRLMPQKRRQEIQRKR